MGEYYGELREFPDKSSNIGLFHGRVYGPFWRTEDREQGLSKKYQGVKYDWFYVGCWVSSIVANQLALKREQTA